MVEAPKVRSLNLIDQESGVEVAITSPHLDGRGVTECAAIERAWMILSETMKTPKMQAYLAEKVRSPRPPAPRWR